MLSGEPAGQVAVAAIGMRVEQAVDIGRRILGGGLYPIAISFRCCEVDLGRPHAYALADAGLGEAAADVL